MTATDRRSRVRASRRRGVRAPRGGPVQRLTLPPRADPYAPTLTPVEPRRRSYPQAYIRNAMTADLLLGVGCALLAGTVRFSGSSEPQHTLVSLCLPLAWLAAVSLANGYEARFVGQAGAEEYRVVGRALLYLFAGFSIVSYSGRLELSRGYVALVLGLLGVGALLIRVVMRHRLRRRRRAGECLQRTLVVGRSDSAAALVESMRGDATSGLSPVGVCALDLGGRPLTAEDSVVAGVPVVGTPVETIEVVDLMEVEVVAVASHPDLAGTALRRLAWALEERGVDLVVSPGLLDVAGPRMTIRPSKDLSLLHIERPTALRRNVVLKTLLDRSAALVMLVLLSPVFLVVAVLIRADDRGPVFYRQQRVGVRGELFAMVKFRSMRAGADSMVAALAAHDEGNGVLFKMREDPRITRVGKVLRRYSIDELPQLINVVRGEMSLVGPRPPLPQEVLEYESDAIRRLHVLPGMTGLWQVSGRSDLSWQESLRLDLRYVDNWSPVTDVWILLRTVQAVFSHRGAY